MAPLKSVTNPLKDPHPLAGKKILQVLPKMGQGGVERGTVQIAAALLKVGAIPYVAAGIGPLSNDLKRLSVSQLSLPLDLKNPFSILYSFWILWRFMGAEKIDLIHARSRLPAWIAYFLARRFKIPFITTFHGTYNFSGIIKKYYNSVMARGDRVIAISNHIHNHIQQNYRHFLPHGRPPTVIYRGVDLDVLDPEKIKTNRLEKLVKQWKIDPGNPIILMPGRLTRWKGQSVLIKAINRLKHMSFSCVFVGDAQGRNGYVDELNQLIAHYGLNDRVFLMGPTTDMAAAYSLATCVVHASTDAEAFGRIIAESSAMGKYVLASNLGAPSEIIIPGVTGDLYDAGDDGALSILLEKALTFSPEKMAEIADAGRSHVKHFFSSSVMANKTLALYDEALKLRHTP